MWVCEICIKGISNIIYKKSTLGTPINTIFTI